MALEACPDHRDVNPDRYAGHPRHSSHSVIIPEQNSVGGVKEPLFRDAERARPGLASPAPRR
jgi:hypothetical protein